MMPLMPPFHLVSLVLHHWAPLSKYKRSTGCVNDIQLLSICTNNCLLHFSFINWRKHAMNIYCCAVKKCNKKHIKTFVIYELHWGFVLLIRRLGAFLCVVLMFSPSQLGISPGAPVSSSREMWLTMHITMDNIDGAGTSTKWLHQSFHWVAQNDTFMFKWQSHLAAVLILTTA